MSNDQPHAPYQLLIRDLPRGERPRERLRFYGEGALSTVELLAILLRVGRPQESALAVAARLLAAFGGLKGLAQAPFGELEMQPALGEAKTARIKAALEIGRRLLTASPEERPIISSPDDVFHLMSGDMAFLEQEHLRTILLNTKNQVIGIAEVSRGTVNTAQVRPAEVFREAVRRTSPAIIIVHNHPSGDPAPSAEDISVTRGLIEAGRVLDVEVLDHVIVTQGRFISLREKRLGFAAEP